MKPAVSKTGPHRSSYIHELDDWPAFRWNEETVTDPLVQAKYRLAELVGSGNILGEKAASELTVHHLTDSAVASSNIENEFPDPNVMRQAITLVQSRPGVTSGNSRRGGRWRCWRCAEFETRGTPRVSKPTSRPRPGGDSPGAILRPWLLIITLPSRRPGASPPGQVGWCASGLEVVATPASDVSPCCHYPPSGRPGSQSFGWAQVRLQGMKGVSV